MHTSLGKPIALIGCGVIGISFAGLYLQHTKSVVRIYDPRPDLRQHLETLLPKYLNTETTGLEVRNLVDQGQLAICSCLEDACRDASIIQEQGPERLDVKVATWQKVLQIANPKAHLWSSTSGITASQQTETLTDKTRLLVVHPFNPPHLMPLIEIVPSSCTRSEETQFAFEFFTGLKSGHRPVVLKKEVPGFVGNRLAFVLFREALHLVKEGVVSVEDLDQIMENSLGPRWAVTGPFKSYNYGGGDGFGSFMHNLSHTIEAVWDDAGTVSLQGTAFLPTATSRTDERVDWVQEIVNQVDHAYGRPTPVQLRDRDERLTQVLHARSEHRATPSDHRHA